MESPVVLLVLMLLSGWNCVREIEGARFHQPSRNDELNDGDIMEILNYLEGAYDNFEKEDKTSRRQDFAENDREYLLSPRQEDDVSHRSRDDGLAQDDDDRELAELQDILLEYAKEEEAAEEFKEYQELMDNGNTYSLDDVLSSNFLRREDMKQFLLQAAILEDSLNNKEAMQEQDEPMERMTEENMVEEEDDKNDDDEKKEEDISILEPDGDFITSDGKKERGDNKAEMETFSDSEDESKQDEILSEIKKESDDVGDDAKMDYAKKDVDELRALLTEMVDSSRAKEALDGKSSADDVTPEAANIEFDVRLPGVTVTQDDTYLCKTVKIAADNATKPIYIVEYIPHAVQTVAHHMLVYGCEEPGMRDTPVWDCGGVMNSNGKTESKFIKGSICDRSYSDETIMWAWARDAPAFHLPKGVGFKVGAGAKVQYLVLQVHYKSASVFKGGKKDYSGVTALATITPQPRLAGVYVLGSVEGTIQPHTEKNFDIECQYEQTFVIHPFAYRTHTHALGVKVLGVRVRDGDWTLLGARNPQSPEAFYPMPNKNMTIRYGDWLAARCEMRNFRNIPTSIGSRHTDEMCNFYIMFWVETKYEAGMDAWSKFCSNGFPWTSWSTLPSYYQ